MLARGVLRGFGQGSFLLWALIGYRGFRLIFHKEDRRPWRYVLVDGLLVLSACALLTSIGGIFLDKNPAAYSGKFSAQLFGELFGRWGGLFISCVLMGAVLMWRSGTRPGALGSMVLAASGKRLARMATNRLDSKIESRGSIPLKKPCRKSFKGEPPKRAPVPSAGYQIGTDGCFSNIRRRCLRFR